MKQIKINAKTIHHHYFIFFARSFAEKEINQSRTFLYYCIYGYGCPTLFLAAILITHHVEGEHVKPGFGVNNCWFAGKIINN